LHYLIFSCIYAQVATKFVSHGDTKTSPSVPILLIFLCIIFILLTIANPNITLEEKQTKVRNKYDDWVKNDVDYVMNILKFLLITPILSPMLAFCISKSQLQPDSTPEQEKSAMALLSFSFSYFYSLVSCSSTAKLPFYIDSSLCS
jgi:hypothetical protein